MSKYLPTLLACLVWTPGCVKIVGIGLVLKNNKLHFTAWSLIPSITTEDCRMNNKLCLRVDFHDNGPNGLIMLDEINHCVYTGTFQNEQVAVAALSLIHI